MAPPSSATAKPVEKPATPPAAPPKEEAAKKKPEAAKIEGKAEVKVDAKGPEAKAESKSDKKSDAKSYFSDPDNWWGRAQFIQGWQDLNNNQGLFGDHSGPGFGLNLGLKYRFGERHQIVGGLGLQHNRTSYDLEPGSSHLNTTAFGLAAGYRFSIIPESLTIGPEIFLGPAFMASSCTQNELGFCDGESGTLTNLNAQLNPVDAVGFRTGIGLNVGAVRDILSIGFMFSKDWGGGLDIETVTQGTYSQPFSPATFMFTIGGEIPSLFSKKTYERSTYTRAKKAEEPKAADKKPVTPPPAPQPQAKPAAKTEPTPAAPKAPTTAELFTQFDGYKKAMDGYSDRVKQIYDKDIKETRRAGASVFGGQKQKNAKMEALAQEAQKLVTSAELDYQAAAAVIAQLEVKSDKLSGEEKSKLEAAKKDLVGARGDGKLSMYEAASDKKYGIPGDAKKVVDYFNHYAKQTPDVNTMELDLSELEKPADYKTAPKPKEPKKPGKQTKPAPAPKQDRPPKKDKKVPTDDLPPPTK